MKCAVQTILGVGILLSLAGPARPDVITDWNEAAVAAGVSVAQPTFLHTRSVAMVHVAMFDALNSIERRYSPYRVQLQAPNNTSREAAASAAAHYLLVRQ